LPDQGGGALAANNRKRALPPQNPFPPLKAVTSPADMETVAAAPAAGGEGQFW